MYQSLSVYCSCLFTKLCPTLLTVAHQAPLSVGFPRQEHWRGLPFPFPGDLPNSGIELTSPALAGGFFTTEPLGKLLSLRSVQFSRSVVSDFLQPHESQHARPPCPSPTPGVYSIESVMPSSHLILCCPLLLLPPIPPSIRVFSNESTLHIRWPQYGSFSFSISPSNEHPGLISFRMEWLHLLAV